jgi:hypothetical protein
MIWWRRGGPGLPNNLNFVIFICGGHPQHHRGVIGLYDNIMVLGRACKSYNHKTYRHFATSGHGDSAVPIGGR